MTQPLDKFWLLMWKNYTLQIRHRIQTLMEILIPTIFSIFLVLLRNAKSPEDMKAVSYSAFNPVDGIYSGNLEKITTILFAPMNPHVTKVMEETAKKLKLKAEGAKNAESMQVLMQDEDNLKTYLGGVQFDDLLNGDNSSSLPKDLSVTIRFPAELRYKPSKENLTAPDSWGTNLLFPIFSFAGPRSPNSSFTAPPHYYEEGFLAVQTALSQSILEAFQATALPTIQMQRFPYPSWKSDPFLEALRSITGLMMVMSFIYNAINIIKSVTIEKEHQLKETMKIMGLPNWLHWTAWFLKAFIFLFISIILITLILTFALLQEHSVFTFSNRFIVFLLLLFYICSIITFCFMVSVFFSKANIAAAVGGVAFFLTYLPFLFIKSKYAQMALSTKLLASLACSTAMAMGFQLILRFEGTGEGAQFSNLFLTVSPDDNLTLGFVLMMLAADSVIYMLIALYIEGVFPGQYGVPQPWYFPCTATYWGAKPMAVPAEDFSNDENVDRSVMEKEPTNLRVGVRIRKLRKAFGHKVAVRDISLNMYEDQITVLLGHNGAGKTTTMSMLTGVIPPTSGTAYVSGYNIRTDMWKVRDSLGLCPQHNVLFNDLTVEEHLYFFGRLKGVSKDRIQSEIRMYIELLELGPKMKKKSSTLSGGMKRKLSVGIALCGNSKVVMLDEPTAGMDPSARRALWNLLLKQKKGRTMLLTTHFMDEADLLGDRIAIMAGGKIQCCGSSFFLKKRYGAGYHLIMDKSQSCDPASVTRLLKKYIPEIEVHSNIGSELTYLLSESRLPVFEDMLRDLEDSSSSLGIRSYGISLTTLEEVFMKVGADYGQEEAHNAMDDGRTGKQSKQKRPDDSIRVQIGEGGLLTGCSLINNQILAMLLKKAVCTARAWAILLIQMLLPVLFVMLTLLSERSSKSEKKLPVLKLSLDRYDRPVTILGGTGAYKKEYLNALKEDNHLYEDIEGKNISEYIIDKTIETTATVRQRYILGTTFTDNTITALFNNEPFHSPPLALSMAVNSIVRNKLGSSHRIRLSNHPLPYTLHSKFSQLKDEGNVGKNLGSTLNLAMIFVTPLYLLFYVRERVVNAKHLQFVSGATVSIFWIVSYIWDLLTFILTAVCLIIVIVAFQEKGYNTAPDLGRVFLILILFGYAMLPLNYLGSLLFNVPATGYTRMLLFNIVTGYITFVAVSILSGQSDNAQKIGNALDVGFLVFPHYCLYSGFKNTHDVYTTYDICKNLVNSCTDGMSGGIDECWNLACNYTSECCKRETEYFAWKSPGIGKHILFFLAVGTLIMLLVIGIDYGFFQKIIYIIKHSRVQPSYGAEYEDPDVCEEKRKIRNATQSELQQYAVVLKDVTKYYNKFLAVNGLCLGVKRYECFGLLGINGAGKTTTFKMLTGDTPITHGDVWIKGISLKSNLKKVRKFIGYCPQFDAILDDMTGYETIKMFCLLRGITLSESKEIAQHLARVFDFERHLYKQVKQYSGGNKRKLSTAIALIGDPPVLYLDEPTTGMDPATKRFLWNALCKIRDTGKCIFLTSHSMEECEALCTRLAIMVNGTFKCLGSTQRLKNKFSEGYTLTIKAKKTDSRTLITDVLDIERFVAKNFPTAVLSEKHQEMLTYFIKESKSLSWSRMFGIMEAGKKRLNIEDYSLGQCSLEQVFLSFTKYQRPDFQAMP